MKILAVVGLAAVLAACDIGATTPSQATLPPLNESSPSASASAEMSADESPAAMSCSEAFANMDTASVIAMGSLDAASDALDSTIAACSSADEWEAAAEGALPDVDISNPQAFIGARCAEATTLAGAPLCAEVAP